MSEAQISGRTRYSQALAGFEPEVIVASLSDEVTIRVAVHDQPLQGKDTAAFLFGVLTQELTPFRLVGEIVEGDQSVVMFQTTLHGQHADGLNVVTFAPDNRVSELTVFFRPLSALQLIAEVIGSHMAQRCGSPPEGLQ
jgi:hypothetical protein